MRKQQWEPTETSQTRAKCRPRSIAEAHFPKARASSQGKVNRLWRLSQKPVRLTSIFPLQNRGDQKGSTASSMKLRIQASSISVGFKALFQEQPEAQNIRKPAAAASSSKRCGTHLNQIATVESTGNSFKEITCESAEPAAPASISAGLGPPASLEQAHQVRESPKAIPSNPSPLQQERKRRICLRATRAVVRQTPNQLNQESTKRCWMVPGYCSRFRRVPALLTRFQSVRTRHRTHPLECSTDE